MDMNLNELDRISKLIPAEHDPVLAELMPPDLKEFLEKAPVALEWAREQLVKTVGLVASMNEEKVQLQRALDMYAVQGTDPMFRANLNLCLSEAKKKK